MGPRSSELIDRITQDRVENGRGTLYGYRGNGKVIKERKRWKEIHTRGLMLESKRQALRETQDSR
jgi:hypothetical protein